MRIFMKSFVKENPITGTIEIMQLFVPCFSSSCHLSSSNYMLSTSSTIAVKEKPNRFGRFTFHAFDYTPPDDRRLGRPVSRMAESHTAGPALFFSLPKEKRKKASNSIDSTARYVETPVAFGQFTDFLARHDDTVLDERSC